MDSQVGWVLRCRGLPYSITKAEIEKFFDTSTLATNTEDCVQITYNEEGRPSGECFVVMSNEESYYNALRKNNEYLKSRYIEVFESDCDDMNRALQKGAVNRQYYGGSEAPIVKLRGLPFSVTDEQVSEFFSGLQIVSLKIKRKEDGEATGEGYVKFSRQDEATAALEKHMQKIGHRYIEVFKGSMREMKEEVPLDSKKPKKIGYGGKPAYMGGPQDHKVFMRGIPFKASQGDVIKFFTPLMPRHIEIIIGDDGRPSGTAYAFFHSHEDALLAMEKDKENMDTRYVDLFLESSPEPVAMENSVTQAQQLIAQAHGLQPPAPQIESVQESAVTLSAQELIAQAHGMAAPVSGGYPSAAPPSQFYGQPPAPYQGMQPPHPSYPPPPPPAQASGPPVRKRLMAGAVRPVDSYQLAEDDYPSKRYKNDDQRGGGRFKRGGELPTRRGRGAPTRGFGRFPPRGGRGGPPTQRGGFPTRGAGFGRKPISLMATVTDASPDTNDTSNGANGSAEAQPGRGDVPGTQTDVYSGYPSFPTPSSAHQDPNSGFQAPITPYSGYQAPNTTYPDPYAGYQSYTDTSSGYTGQAYPTTATAISATDYTSYLSGSSSMQQYPYQA